MIELSDDEIKARCQRMAGFTYCEFYNRWVIKTCRLLPRHSLLVLSQCQWCLGNKISEPDVKYVIGIPVQVDG